ncbi:MAG: T9SS type A sorting domain-containing protein [Cryomorphaceae bacterium]|nr:T9SS type A sorting domain-containing protein [Cryomorphaceae bacterium]
MKNMYKMVLALAFCFGQYAMNGQYYYTPSITPGNPGGLNQDAEFPVGAGIPGGWTEIHPGSTATPAWSSTATIPFGFQFNGSPVTQYKVSTSGVLTFDVTSAVLPPSANTAIPSPLVPSDAVMVWGLEAPGANDKIVTKTFGNAPNRQHWITFSSYDIPGVNCWTYWSIVLEETTNYIYIVDQRHACAVQNLTLGIQFNSTSAVSVDGSPSINPKAGTDPTDADNWYYKFMPGTRPDRDMAGAEVVIPDFLVMGDAPFTIQAELANFGANTVTSASLNYSINGGSPVTAAAPSINIQTNQLATVSHPTAWTPAASGIYTIAFWASNINGGADENPANDTAYKTVQVVSNFTQRHPLMEVFSSSTCGPCAPANASFKALMDQQSPGKFNKLKYQMSWPGAGDPYFTLEAQTRRTYYGVSSVPRMQIDGQWDQHAGQATQPVIDGFRDVPSFLYFRAAFQVSGQTVNAQIDITPLTNMSGDIRLYAAIYEKVTTNNAKNNGESVFYDVFKKFMTSDEGDPLPNIVENDKQSHSFTYTFNGSYILPPSAQNPVNHATNHTVENFGNLGVMFWVQDNNSKEILQSGNAHDGQLSTGKSELNKNEVRLYPNPSNGVINLDFTDILVDKVQYQVYNTVGQVVLSGEFTNATEEYQSLDAGNLPSGHYFIRLVSPEMDKKIKFNIAR